MLKSPGCRAASKTYLNPLPGPESSRSAVASARIDIRVGSGSALPNKRMVIEIAVVAAAHNVSRDYRVSVARLKPVWGMQDKGVILRGGPINREQNQK